MAEIIKKRIRVTASARSGEQKVYPIPKVHPMGDDPEKHVPVFPPQEPHILPCGIWMEIEVSEKLLETLKLDGCLKIEDVAPPPPPDLTPAPTVTSTIAVPVTITQPKTQKK